MLFWASNFLCAGGSSSCRSVRPRCLRKRYSVEADTPGEFRPEDKDSSRSRVVPVRCGFSRLRRSMRSASWGGEEVSAGTAQLLASDYRVGFCRVYKKEPSPPL